MSGGLFVTSLSLRDQNNTATLAQHRVQHGAGRGICRRRGIKGARLLRATTRLFNWSAFYSAQFRSRSTPLMQQSKQGRPDRVGHTQRKNGLNLYARSLCKRAWKSPGGAGRKIWPKKKRTFLAQCHDVTEIQIIITRASVKRVLKQQPSRCICENNKMPRSRSAIFLACKSGCGALQRNDHRHR